MHATLLLFAIRFWNTKATPKAQKNIRPSEMLYHYLHPLYHPNSRQIASWGHETSESHSASLSLLSPWMTYNKYIRTGYIESTQHLTLLVGSLEGKIFFHQGIFQNLIWLVKSNLISWHDRFGGNIPKVNRKLPMLWPLLRTLSSNLKYKRQNFQKKEL